MAHPNVDQRRSVIARLLAAGEAISSGTRKALAERFGCSPNAIYADITALQVAAAQGVGAGFTTPATRALVRRRDSGRCQYCGVEAAHMVAEHIIPAHRGGHARPYNLTLACRMCNQRKGNAVWVPLNLDAITAAHPAWRERILAVAAEDRAGITPAPPADPQVRVGITLSASVLARLKAHGGGDLSAGIRRLVDENL